MEMTVGYLSTTISECYSLPTGEELVLPTNDFFGLLDLNTELHNGEHGKIHDDALHKQWNFIVASKPIKNVKILKFDVKYLHF